MSQVPLTPVGTALAGALGAVFSNAVVYPLDTVKTRLQASEGEGTLPLHASTSTRTQQDAKGKRQSSLATGIRLPANLLGRLKRWNVLTMLIRIIKTEGLSGAFKGFTANTINTFSMQFAYFFFHSLLRSAYIRRRSPGQALSTPSELLLGASAGALAQIFTIPVSVIATRQQLYVPPTKDAASPSLLQTGAEIIAESGVTGLWTGLKPGLVLTVNPAITYGSFERMKSAVLARPGHESGRLSVGESFWLGVASKAVATVVTYPYIFAKVRLQARRDPRTATIQEQGSTASYAQVATQEPAADAAVVSDKTPVPPQPAPVNLSHHDDRTAIGLLKKVYEQQGLKGWYTGLTAQLIKAVLCQGILFVSKDQFERSAWVILASLATLRQRLSLK